MTVALYLERWLDYIRAAVRESTWEQNEVHARLHMVPVLGNIKLDRLNALKVQCLYCVKLDEGLSMGTVR